MKEYLIVFQTTLFFLKKYIYSKFSNNIMVLINGVKKAFLSCKISCDWFIISHKTTRY